MSLPVVTASRVRWTSLLPMMSTRLLLNRMYCGARNFRQCLLRRGGSQQHQQTKPAFIGGSNFLVRTSLQNRRCYTEGKKTVEDGLKAAAESTAASSATSSPPEKKQSLIQKFKSMYKDYYYVLIPVHVVTSIGWLGSFYQVSKSGMDIAGYMKKMGFSDGIISKITESGMGHIAVAYALYKIATPARYTVTLGGTTWAINRLTRMGYIKPAKEIISQGKERLKNLKPDRK